MKAYTAFLFEGVDDPRKLHCTHFYLGETDSNEIISIAQVIQNFLDKTHCTMPLISFDEEDYFGPNQDIRVLRPRFETYAMAFMFWGPLRTELAALNNRPLQIPYRPHVTTKRERVDLQMRSYALVVDHQVHVEWFLGMI